MALNVNAALLKLSPLTPIGFDLPDKKAASMERERLQLMREQFEEVKRQNVQDAEWRKIAEAGAMTREQMASDRQAEHDQQLAIAENMKQRQAAIDSMHARGADVEGMHLDANRLNELGGLAEYQGVDENGFPSFRVEIDAEKARQAEQAQEEQGASFFDDSDEDTGLPKESIPQSLDRMNALGYDTLGLRDAQPETARGRAAPLSTEDAFRSAQRAARGPDEAPPAEPEAPPEDTGVSAYDYAGEADAAQNFAGQEKTWQGTDPAEYRSPESAYGSMEEGMSAPEVPQPPAPAPPRTSRAPMAPPPLLEPSIFQATGRPARPADRADIMGSVPKNVIDTGAMQEQRKQRMGPVMDNLVKGMPQAYQAHTRANADAAMGMGLPADKAADQALKFNAPANAAFEKERGAELDAAKEERALAAKAHDPKAQEELHNFGLTRARDSYKDMKVDLRISGMERADEVVRMLTNDNTADDAYAINKLMVMDEQSGAQSNADALRLSGGETLSTIDQAKAWLHKQIDGGYWDKQKEAMLDFARTKRASYRDIARGWVASQQDAADKALHPLSRAGRLEFLESLPAWFIKEYDEAGDDDAEEPGGGAPAADAAPASGATQGAGAAYVPNAAPDLAPGESPIPKSSRIAYVHNNPGNLVFAGQEGAEPGEDKLDKDGKAVAKWAKFPTVEAGFSALRKQIEKDQEMTIRAFITKYAPPSDSNDTEKYIADAARELKAEPDDIVYYVDPYDMMRFLARHESGTEMPYQYGKLDADRAKFEQENPAPTGTNDDEIEGIDYRPDEPPLEPPLEHPDPGYKPEDEPALPAPPGGKPPPPRHRYTPGPPSMQLLRPAAPWMEPPSLIEPGTDRTVRKTRA